MSELNLPEPLQHITYIISDIGKALTFEWIAEQLDPEQYRLSFILLNPGASVLEDFLKERGIPVYRVQCRGKKDWPLAFAKLCALLLKLRPQAVHCHLFVGSLLGLTAAKLTGVRKRIYTRHHSDYHHRYFPGGVKWDRMCNKLATHIVAPSKAVWKVLVEMDKAAPEKIVTIHHGFDLDYFRRPDPVKVGKLREQYGTAGHRPVIGVISRFTELKGIQYIIPAFRRLLNDYPDARILFFNARGDYENTILGMLEDIPRQRYELITFENDLASAYQLMDIFIQASTDTNIEAFGQTYVEALAAGVPSIFTLSGIAQDFITDGQNAIVVPFKNADSIYEALKKLLKDEALRQRLITNGKESVAHTFALPRMISSLEELYQLPCGAG